MTGRRRHRRVVAPSTGPAASEQWEDSTPGVGRSVDEPAAKQPEAGSSGSPTPARTAGRPVIAERALSAEDQRWLEDRPPHWG